MPVSSSRWRDVAALQCILAAPAAELAMREMYHRATAEILSLAMLAVSWVLLTTFALWGCAWIATRHAALPGRLSMLAGFVLAFWLLAGKRILALDDMPIVSPVLNGLWWLLVMAATALLASLGSERWSALRRALVVGCVLFVTAQPMLAVWRAPSFAWPPLPNAREPLAALPAGARSTTVFLLLDELNARSSAPFVALLEQRGLNVRFKSLRPVGGGTAKVIPAMFSGQRFVDPKPCTPTAVCSEGRVLDFSRITASRGDVDIVGFYEPYCAIRGLRSCVRSTERFQLFNADRWRCAAWRRVGFPQGVVSKATCERAYSSAWFDMVDNTLSALDRAPVWTKGGFLFAHVPLPHPPGITPGATLQAHYDENLARALRLVDQLLGRMRTEPGDLVRLVIFSDHPLRQALWCDTHFPYAMNGCTNVPAYADVAVPLIVAGNDALPALDGVVSNDQVFSLAR